MIYSQRSVDIDKYEFDFTDWFPSTDTITSVSVSATPSGLTEVTAQRSASGMIYTLAIDGGLATVGLAYTVACQATSSSGKRHTLYKQITVIAEPAGISPIVPATGASGLYSATLAQAGTAAPTVTVANSDTIPAGTPVWTRTAVGTFIGTLAGAFLANKTRVTAQVVPLQVGSESSAAGKRLTDDTVQIIVRDYADNPVDGFTVLDVNILTYT